MKRLIQKTGTIAHAEPVSFDIGMSNLHIKVSETGSTVVRKKHVGWRTVYTIQEVQSAMHFSVRILKSKNFNIMVGAA